MTGGAGRGVEGGGGSMTEGAAHAMPHKGWRVVSAVTGRHTPASLGLKVNTLTAPTSAA